MPPDLLAAQTALGDDMAAATARSWPSELGDAALSGRKRCFDIVVAGLLILFLAPTLLAIAAAIFIESGGPVIFRQDRTGLAGRHFTIFKFRTMIQAPSVSVWTQRDDARVTRLGAFLRRTSLDELPQLINVLIGDMSLVGPRPHAVQMDEEWQARLAGYGDRFRVRPGITGLAQVSDLRGSVDHIDQMRERVAADVEYVDRWTISLDLMILVRTLPHLWDSGNAY
jgi:putative colanic acid biosynthesis UDP-glucose lipid carrier transferase